MYILVLMVCMTFESDTACQKFERNYRFQTLEQCQFIAKIEQGQYSEKINQRPWAKYSWSCQDYQLLEPTMYVARLL